MQNTRDLKLKSNRGFSLIEIMIVLIIIGGLMAVIIPKVQDGREQSNVKNTKMRLSEISTKVNEYYAECGKYPAAITFLTDDDAGCKNWTGNPKLKSLLKDAWNGDIQYSVSGSGYNLKSQGKDKKEGGSSFDKDIYSDESVSGEE
ncbi:MAG: type II secretion system protein GspG [Moraxellaceae bacterium]|nr:type II secretion system protein GspG [Pseudobdellovibrionaceae bacterium]